MSKAYEVVNQRILDLMSKGEIPWVKPWKGSSLNAGASLITKKPYRGINRLMTMGFEVPYFLTYRQADYIGANVRKGERGTPIVFWGRMKTEDSDGEETSRMYARFYTVFNVCQIDNLPPSVLKLIDSFRAPLEINQIPKHDDAERIATETKADVRYSGEQRAYYSPMLDYINMPARNSFTNQAEFYSTLFHELGHWTGHANRLDRKELTEACYFGSHKYSQEELTAELTAAFVCSSLNISTESSERNSAGYLQSWMKVLKNDPKMLVYAAQRAQKAADLILKVERNEK